MAPYVVAPLEEPRWVVKVGRFVDLLLERWPAARVGVGSVEGSSVGVEALVPVGGREVEVALSGTGQAVTLEGADVESAAEFAEWFVRVVVQGQRGVHLIEAGSMRMVELGGVSVDEIRQQLG